MSLPEVAILSFSTSPGLAHSPRDEAESVQPVVAEALSTAKMAISDIDFVCSGSCDLLMGLPFAFVNAIDALGAWPPIAESHVECDGAFALYEAWLRILAGEADTALVYAFSHASAGDANQVLGLQLDPYQLAPLGLTPEALAALQAQRMVHLGLSDEREWSKIAAEASAAAVASGVCGPRHPDSTQRTGLLRAEHCPRFLDGAAAIVLARREVIGRFSAPLAWISGIEQAVEPHSPGARDMCALPTLKASAARLSNASDVDVAELHATFAHEQVLLRRELALSSSVRINPSGGALPCARPMVSGLDRIGWAARAVASGAPRALAHASSGPCLQHNLLCLLEAP